MVSLDRYTRHQEQTRHGPYYTKISIRARKYQQATLLVEYEARYTAEKNYSRLMEIYQQTAAAYA